MLKMLDIFSGIGGFSLAASWTGGIETIAFCEIEPFCRQVLRKHWPYVPIYDDIKELNGHDLVREHGAIDVICGGFPCQPFSCAGQRRGKDDDRYLWPEMLRIITEVRPAWVIGENVANFANMGLETAIADLENCGEGYEVITFNIPACAVQAPHERKRIWIVAHANSPRWEGGQFSRLTSEAVRACGVVNARFAADTHHVPDAQKNQKTLANRKKWQTWNYDKWRDRGIITGAEREIPEPGICGVDDGVSDRSHRLKALGNAIVPQVVYPILQGIVNIEAAAV